MCCVSADTIQSDAFKFGLLPHDILDEHNHAINGFIAESVSVEEWELLEALALCCQVCESSLSQCRWKLKFELCERADILYIIADSSH